MFFLNAVCDTPAKNGSLRTLSYVKWALFGVHFTSENEGWAVGGRILNSENPGVLLHYNGQWQPVAPPEVSNDWVLWGVHFPSPDLGWAVGTDHVNGRGVLLRYQKCFFSPCPLNEWESIPPPSNVSKLYGVHFTSENEGWAVGADNAGGRGILLHYYYGTCTSEEPPLVSTNWELRDVHFTSSTQGWAVGSNGIQGRGVLLTYHETFLFQLKRISDFFDFSVNVGPLIGNGTGKSAEGRLKALRNMISASRDFVLTGDFPGGCQQLTDAFNRTDGMPNPPDFAAGPATLILAEQIRDLMETVECTGM